MPDHERLHKYEVLHNKLSGLEYCRWIVILLQKFNQSFHNPLVELAVYRHPCHHQKTGQPHPSGTSSVCIGLKVIYCFGDTANRNDCCNAAEKEQDVIFAVTFSFKTHLDSTTKESRSKKAYVLRCYIFQLSL